MLNCHANAADATFKVDTGSCVIQETEDDEDVFGRSLRNTPLFQHVALDDHDTLRDVLRNAGSGSKATITFLVSKKLTFVAECRAQADPSNPSFVFVWLNLPSGSAGSASSSVSSQSLSLLETGASFSNRNEAGIHAETNFPGCSEYLNGSSASTQGHCEQQNSQFSVPTRPAGSASGSCRPSRQFVSDAVAASSSGEPDECQDTEDARFSSYREESAGRKPERVVGRPIDHCWKSRPDAADQAAEDGAGYTRGPVNGARRLRRDHFNSAPGGSVELPSSPGAKSSSSRQQRRFGSISEERGCYDSTATSASIASVDQALAPQASSRESGMEEPADDSELTVEEKWERFKARKAKKKATRASNVSGAKGRLPGISLSDPAAGGTARASDNPMAWLHKRAYRPRAARSSGSACTENSIEASFFGSQNGLPRLSCDGWTELPAPEVSNRVSGSDQWDPPEMERREAAHRRWTATSTVWDRLGGDPLAIEADSAG